MTDMEIETFLTVLRSGSMTAAAQALYITQPTLSARLQTLEDEVGTPLFVRGKGLRRLELTEAGTRFLPLAQRWQRLMAEMHGIAAAEARTHFRIGAAYTANQYVLPPVYKRFLERDLPVALRVETLSSQQAQEAVTRRELDMAIVEDDVGFNPELQVTPLFRESFYMICSEGSDYPELVNPHDLDMSQEINVSQRREVQVWNDYWFGSDARPLLNTDTMQTFYCTAADDETGTYTWEKPKEGGPGQDLPLHRPAAGPYQLSHRPPGGGAAPGGGPVSGGPALGAAAAPGRDHLFLTALSLSKKSFLTSWKMWKIGSQMGKSML